MSDHEEGTAAWELARAAEEASRMPAADDESDATDRVAIAVYKVGAEIIAGLERLSARIGKIDETLATLQHD